MNWQNNFLFRDLAEAILIWKSEVVRDQKKIIPTAWRTLSHRWYHTYFVNLEPVTLNPSNHNMFHPRFKFNISSCMFFKFHHSFPRDLHLPGSTNSPTSNRFIPTNPPRKKKTTLAETNAASPFVSRYVFFWTRWDVHCHASWPEGRDHTSKLLVLTGDLGHAPSWTREILEEGTGTCGRNLCRKFPKWH